MKIYINIKGVSNRKEKIRHITYEYDCPCATLADFLAETVRITVHNYNDRLSQKETAGGDDYDRSEDGSALLSVLTAEKIDDMAQTGKVSFGVLYSDKQQDEAEAVEHALTCFEDGMVAVFINNERIEELSQELHLKENDVVTFVRLIFLAGRMW